MPSIFSAASGWLFLLYFAAYTPHYQLFRTEAFLKLEGKLPEASACLINITFTNRSTNGGWIIILAAAIAVGLERWAEPWLQTCACVVAIRLKMFDFEKKLERIWLTTANPGLELNSPLKGEGSHRLPLPILTPFFSNLFPHIIQGAVTQLTDHTLKICTS